MHYKEAEIVLDSLVPRPFPGRSHLQYLIAYSMQIRRGKAWEIWSRAVMSGRQMVDIRGAVPDSSNSRFVSKRPWHCERWY